MNRYAVLSDIHGNRWALETVLTDIRHRGAAHLLNLGDLFYGPLDPEGTARLLMELDIPSTTILGNEDRVLFESHADPTRHSSLSLTQTSLSEASLRWLKPFRPREQLGSVFLTHGTPEDDEDYLLEVVDASGAHPRKLDNVRALLPGIDIDLVLCGHSHLSRVVQVPGGPLVVNPGSVGLPAYVDDSPFTHVMEAGSPHARYAMVEKMNTSWTVTFIVLPYDWETAAEKADKNGRPDWARALRTGFAQ